jgi:hypothetical protein
MLKLNQHTRLSFVERNVKENEITTEIIDLVFPFFPKETKCISGFVDVRNQYWKVNYHWDILVARIDEFLAMPQIEGKLMSAARAIRQVLLTNPPNPTTGYKDDKEMGVTLDVSASEIIEARHKSLLQSKKDFRLVLIKAKIISQATEFTNPPEKEKKWWLSVAKVAPPGKSTHGLGNALDIKGKENLKIVEICEALGATMVFPESSHIHVEFKDLALLKSKILGV